MMLAEVVYILCGAASFVAAWLLFRAYTKFKTRLLLWSAFCFSCFTASNVLLFMDLVMFPNYDLSIIRLIPALAGLVGLIYGLIWDTAA